MLPQLLSDRLARVYGLGMRLGGVLVAGIIGAAALAPTPPADAHDPVAARAARHVRLSAPSDVVEGQSYTLKVRVPSPRKVAKAVLQYERANDHVIDSVSRWTRLERLKLKGHKAVSVPIRADEAREYAFRVRVTYRGTKRPVVSAAKRVDYWHWVGLPIHYDSAGSGYDPHDYVHFTVGGRDATGWYLDRGASAEDRYTLPGRCRSFHATAAMADGSATGATGTITLAAVDASGTAKPLWTSPTLVAGKSVPVSMGLVSVTRLSILGTNTSGSTTDGDVTMTPEARPALLDPQFLCHLD